MTVLPLPVHRETTGPYAGMAVLRLEQPGKPVVVLDEELIHRLEAALQGLPRDIRALVVASASDRVFVAGADLKAISDWDDARLMDYLDYAARIFGMLPRLPFPTAAAINGAALGGGLELAMHCDGLVAAGAPVRDGQPKPYPIGLPEAGLQICPGWGGTNLLPARMRDAADAISRTCSGRTMLIDEAIAGGLIDRAVPSGSDLIAAAKSWLTEHVQVHGQRRDGRPLRWIGRDACRNTVALAYSNLQAHLGGADPAAACMKAVGAGLESGWPAALEVERRELNRLRAAPAGRAAIRAFLDKGKK